MNRICSCSITFLAAVLCLSTTTIIRGADFPGGISPSHVFATMTLVDENLSQILEAQEKKSPRFPAILETSIHPMHVYQMAAGACNRVKDLVEKFGGQPGADINPEPRKYAPQDVKALGNRMQASLLGIAPALGVTALKTNEVAVSGKVPSDVFEVVVRIWVKAGVAAGQFKSTPNDVFTQMSRGVEDVATILQTLGKELPAPAAAPTTRYKPKDVVQMALETRRTLNSVRESLQEKTVDVPTLPADYRVRPLDVFLQSQILLAELNLIKSSLGQKHATPEGTAVKRKSPTDVWVLVKRIRDIAGLIKK